MRSSRSPVLSSQTPVASSRKNRTFLRLLKFNAVGGLGIGVQLIALAILRSWWKLDYLLATGLAVEAAVLHNFLWHQRFTWVDRPALGLRHSFTRLARFHATNGAVSILGNLLLMRWMVGELRWNDLASNLLAVSVCSLINFLLSDRLVFERKEKEDGFPDEGTVTLAR